MANEVRCALTSGGDRVGEPNDGDGGGAPNDGSGDGGDPNDGSGDGGANGGRSGDAAEVRRTPMLAYRSAGDSGLGRHRPS